jgi:hypothetical protein
LGAGFQVLGIQPNGRSSSFGVLGLIESPPQFYGTEYAFEVMLVNAANELVNDVEPESGQLQPIRIGQALRADMRQFPGINVPNNVVWSRQQFVAMFPSGLSLEPGRLYAWRVRIDGETQPSWDAEFYVPRRAPGPVIG